jgi:hypothetical protein
VVLTTHPLLVPRLRMGRAISLPPLQGHEACNRVNVTFLSFSFLEMEVILGDKKASEEKLQGLRQERFVLLR